MINRKALVSSIVVFMLGLIALFVDARDLINILPLLYLGVLLISFYVIYSENDIYLSFFYPSSVMILYVSLFFFMGSYAFKHELVQMYIANQIEYYYFNDIGLISFYFMCAIGITLSTKIAKRTGMRGLSLAVLNKNEFPFFHKRGIILSVLISILTIVFEIPLPGGTGSFSSTFFMFAAIYLTYYAKLLKSKYRFLVYLLFSVLLSVFFYSDRRLLFYYAFIVAFLELYDTYAARFNLKYMVSGALVFLLLVTANIAMSIQRGVGSFGTTSVVGAFSYVDDYITSDWAKTMLLHNFEGPPSLFHSYNAVNYMLETGDYKYGTTIAKLLFLPIPRDIYPDKPLSMVYEYTAHFYPQFRAEGGSFIPNMYAEAFWNFGFIGGIAFLYLLFSLFDEIYYRWMVRLRSRVMISNVFFLSSFSLLPFLFRGSGLDLYLLMVILFYSTSVIYKLHV